MSRIGNSAPAANKVGRITSVKQFDALLFAAVLALTAVGYYFLYQVLQTYAPGERFSDANMSRQLVAIIVGIIAALILSSIDYRYYQLPSYIGYIGSMLILVITTIFGIGGSDSSRWIVILGVNFQPSELMKITFIVVISSFFERIAQKRATKLDYVKMAVYMALPTAVIQLQGDTGTALSFIVIFVVMVFVCGIKYRYIFILMGAAVASLPLLWVYVLRDWQKMRIMVFLNPELDKSGISWQPNLARSAIGAGELMGRTLESPAQSRYSQVPERHSDFIFTAIAEHTGFIGCVLLIILFVFILLRCLYIASKACDRYGEFMVAGLSAMMMFHFIENVGMCIGLLPITGIPLPFISYGGTAMISNYLGIGIILSVSVTRDVPGVHSIDGDALAQSLPAPGGGGSPPARPRVRPRIGANARSGINASARSGISANIRPHIGVNARSGININARSGINANARSHSRARARM